MAEGISINDDTNKIKIFLESLKVATQFFWVLFRLLRCSVLLSFVLKFNSIFNLVAEYSVALHFNLTVYVVYSYILKF